MAEEKRMIEGYEVKTAIHIGGKEIIFAENLASPDPFMVCNAHWDNPYISLQPMIRWRKSR